MMAVFEAEFNTARSLIKEFGQPVTWKNFQNFTTTVGKPWQVTGGTYVDYTVDLVFLPENREGYKSQQIDQEKQEGFELVYLATRDFVPTLQDSIVRDSVTYTIRSIDRINPNGEQIVYEIGVKR